MVAAVAGASPLNTTQPLDVQSQQQQADDLLGQPGQGSLPVWLNPERFLAPDFDTDATVADLRRYVPLNTLQTELQTYLATLKAKMIEVINEDYSDYVSLSTRLVNVDGAVVRMRKPLLDLRDKLTVVRESVKGELSALGAGLRRRKEVATARSLLELLQELAHVAGKVDKLLAEVAVVSAAAAATASDDPSSPAPNGTPPAGHHHTRTSSSLPAAGAGASADAQELDARARLLERVAGEVSRLTYQAERGKELAFVRAMEPRVAAARSELSTSLATVLETALQSGSHSAALHCLHAYAELGEAAPAEAALRRLVVAPAVEAVLHEHKAVHTIRMSATAAAGKEDGLRGLLSKIMARVDQAAGPLLTVSLTPQSPLRAFDFLGSSVLVEVDTQLAAQLPSTFSPGVPPAFHANYLAAQAFLDGLEARCQGRTALERLRASAAYTSFLRRWNTSVYFSLVYQEIAGDLEDAVHQGKPDLAAAPQGAAGVVLRPSQVTVGGMQRIVAPEVFLRPLSDRFLRLALQLGARYLSWLSSAIATRQEAAAAAAAGAPLPSLPGSTPAPTTTPGASAAGAAGGAALPSTATPQGTGAKPTPSSTSQGTLDASVAWVASLPVEELAVLYTDAAAVAAHVRDGLAPAFRAALEGRGLQGSSGGDAGQPHMDAEALSAAEEVLVAMAQSLAHQAQVLLGVMGEEVVEACVAVLKQLKGITATYRMTTKGPPTRHSHYVTGALAPLRAFMDSARMGRVAAADRAEVVAGIASSICTRYQALADDLLTTVRKTESSLKRLKKAQQADAGDGSAMSDSDKITLQLHLDVAELGQQFSKFGLQVALLPAFQKLSAAVAPAPLAAGPTA